MFATWFKNQGKAVDVTGNEANDAPPLKKNVRFTMGIFINKAAMEAFNIILLDDQFSTILTAKMWDWSIYSTAGNFFKI